eukprot:175853_1
MACACPCFGDEADAEEKPNQMIQLDGLGMLRLDTQHVGQGSQGARSAKWFYFGETDNRLAVVNMLLCITCFLMWILAIMAISTYFPEANPSGESNNGAGKQNFNGVEEDATNNAIGSTHIDQKATEQTMDVDNLITTRYPVVAKYGNAQATFDRLNILEASKENWEKNKTKFANLKADKSALDSEKVQLEKHLKIYKVAQERFSNENNELKDTVADLKTKKLDLESKKEQLEKTIQLHQGILQQYRVRNFPIYYLTANLEEHLDPRILTHYPLDQAAYESWYSKEHPESKGGEDSNKDTNYDNNNDNDNNTNDVDNPNISIKEQGTNDANQ